MIQVVDYNNKDLGRIKNYDEKFLNTIQEKNLIDTQEIFKNISGAHHKFMDKFVGCVFDRDNNIITLMTEEQYIEYGKKLRKEYRENNKEKIKESNKKYREEHKEEIEKYRQEHKEEIKLKQKEYYENNKELIKEKTKLYREQHKEELKQKKKN